MLAEFEGTSVLPESDVNREYKTQQQMIAIANGDDMWASRDNPNDRLLRMARTVAKEREQPRINLSITSNNQPIPVASNDDHLKRPHR